MGFIALDFDGVVAHFGTKGSRGWFSIFVRRGVSIVCLEKTYRLVREQGFSIQNFLNELKKKVDYKFNKQEIYQEFEEWLADSLVLYPDVLKAVSTWKKVGIPVVIVSAGDFKYQMQKIQLSCIPYDDIMLVRRFSEKPKVLLKLIAKYGEPIILVDNRSDILDKTQRVLKNRDLITILICRPGNEYANRKVKFSHTHIKVDKLNGLQVQKIILSKQNT